MELLYLSLALMLPLLLGSVWLRLAVPSQFAGRQPIILGYGLLIGLVAIPVLMRLIDALGISFTFVNVGSLAVALIMSGILANIICRNAVRADASGDSSFFMLPVWQKALYALLFAVISFRLVTLGLEVVWRPLFPFDATMHWATKARVWFEAARIVPFVDNDLWLEMADANVFTDHHPGYPITIPLLQVWINTAIGRWDESLMNLPWALCLLALGLAFYGQARAAGVGAFVGMVFTYMLLSMPLVNTHVALAGYADLFLGTCYAGAIMAFHNWSVKREHWQGTLAVLLALSCLLIKNEGFYWLLTFIPALVVVSLPLRKAVIALTALFVMTIAVVWLFPKDLTVAGHSLNDLDLYYRSYARRGVIRGFSDKGSWHIFGYMGVCLIPVGYLMAGESRRRYLPIGTALVSAAGLFLILFLFTNYDIGAIRYSAVSRISLHLVPSFMFLMMLLYSEISSSKRTTGIHHEEESEKKKAA